ncbi:class F sortase [Kocuria sp. CNJ-770]|uniref:Class F sortase n=1 Tax=Kocuria oceani TaxID=988827 RepID=A0ABV9TKH4_9MICC|nr:MULTISPECIES: class F sortase [Kocuria]OLT10277.1 class F sortase [Kocuria sp. CNJ-770]
MTDPTTGRRRGRLAPAAAALLLLLLSGCAAEAPAQPTAPSPTASATSSPRSSPAAPADEPAGPPVRSSPSSVAAPSAPPAPGAEAAPVPAPGPVALAASAPVSVRIPSAGGFSELLHLGLRADGSLEVPPTHPGAPASWYTGSPTPGERGPAVLLGHVNATDGGPGVFAGLRGLVPGDRIEVLREDGSTAVFAVERGEQYAKNAFPTHEVYGDTVGAELRLITCDGYDPATGLFDDNYVVYARLLA